MNGIKCFWHSNFSSSQNNITLQKQLEIMGLILENNLLEVAYVLVFSFWLLFTYVVRYYDYWLKRGVPQVPPTFPLGSMPYSVWRRNHYSIAVHHTYQQFGHHRFYGVVDVRTPTIVVNDPDIIKDILVRNFNHFTDRNYVEMSCDSKEHLNNNLMSMRSDEWREMRIKLTPAYTACKMKIMFSLVNECCDYLNDSVERRIETNGVVNINDIMRRFTIDVIGNCAFGLNFNTLNDQNSRFLEISKTIFHYDLALSFKCYLLNLFPALTKTKLFNTINPEVTFFVTNLIRETVSYREENKVTRFDFLDLLIKIKRNESILDHDGESEADNSPEPNSIKSEGISIEEIAAETYLFFSAGYETSSTILSWCLYELSCNPTIQEKMNDEIEQVLNLCDGNISYTAIQKMTYLEQVVNETMRLHPPVGSLNRVCTRKYRIPSSDVDLEEGVTVVIPIYSLHRDAQYFPDPETFDPERFSESKSHGRHPYTFLPFGEGPRMCIGLRFGMMLVKAALVTILSKYAVSLHPDTPYPLQLNPSACCLQPSSALRLVFNKRTWDA